MNIQRDFLRAMARPKGGGEPAGSDFTHRRHRLSDGAFGIFKDAEAKREYAREAYARIRKALLMADSLRLIEAIHRVNAVDLATIKDVSPEKGYAELMRVTDECRKKLEAKEMTT